MRIPINEIKINPGRREALPERVAELAKCAASFAATHNTRTFSK